MEEEYTHPELTYSTGSKVELDIYIEDLKLAIEYQGEQHYKPNYWSSAELAAQRNRDEEKRKACKQVFSSEDNNESSPISACLRFRFGGTGQ